MHPGHVLLHVTDTTSRRKVFPQKHEDNPKMTRSTRHVSGTFLYLLYLVIFTNVLDIDSS